MSAVQRLLPVPVGGRTNAAWYQPVVRIIDVAIVDARVSGKLGLCAS